MSLYYDKSIDKIKLAKYTLHMSMSPNFLHTLGLSETESILYEHLLTLGEVPVSTLIIRTKRKRPTVYKALQTLQGKGLVTMRDIHKKLHAKPESPTRLKELADEKAKQIDEANAALTALLPGMALNYAHSTEKPVVQIYEGAAGLKEIYLDTLKEQKPISALLQASVVEPDLYTWLNNVYVNKRVKQKIHAKIIMDSGAASKEYLAKNIASYKTVKTVDAKQYPFQHEIDIYGDKVAIIHYKKDEPLIGILIHHPQIAQTMRSWFELTWEMIK